MLFSGSNERLHEVQPPAYAEVANLEHELALLKGRRANMHRFAKGGLYVLGVGFGVAILLFIYAIVTDNSDATAKLFLLLCLVTVAGLFAVVAKGTWLEKYLGSNALEVGYGLGAHLGFLEQAIAAREQRLAELKSQQ